MPPLPCIFEHQRSSVTSSLLLCPFECNCSPVTPPLCFFERNCSSVAPTVSIQAPALAHHPGPRRVFSSTTVRVHPHCINSSATVRPSVSPPLYPFERNRSSVAPTVSIRAPALARHSRHVLLSATARRSHPLHLFGCQRSPVTPTMSFRAQPLVYRPRRIYSSPSACLAVSFRAQPLVYRPRCIYSSASTRPLAPPCLFERNRSPDTWHLLATCMRARACTPAITRPCLVLSQVLAVSMLT